MKKAALLAVVTMSVISMTSVRADDLRDRQTAACSTDAMRLCSDAIPDEGKVASCMMSRKSDLTAGCRAFFVDVSTGGNSPLKSNKTSHQSAAVR